jgi:hypothetical protein
LAVSGAVDFVAVAEAVVVVHGFVFFMGFVFMIFIMV